MKEALKKISIGLGIIIFGCCFYLGIFYHADESVKKYLESSDKVKVLDNKKYILFDGEGDDKAIIFYQGAKVENKSYARLMYKLAENGIDCFLLDIPFNFAFFGENYPNSILNKYSYDNWYLSGHSLGGVVASSYLKYNDDKFKGIVFLSSYPNVNLNENLKVISIFAENDKIINKDSYKNAKWSNDYKEFIIKGGNHAGYGNYGNQRGDGISTITNEKQQDEVVEILVSEL